MNRVVSIGFTYYPADPRPKREAEALVEAGMSVDVICLKGKDEKSEERVNGVNVFRLSISRKRKGKLYYLWEYGRFILFAFLKLSKLHLVKNYHLVHVHNMPDILVFCALLPRLWKAKIILDLHDPMPELYMTKYHIGASHPIIRCLRFLEKRSIRFADLVLTPNLAFRDLFLSRGCSEGKIHIVMNSPQETIFKEESTPPIQFNPERFVIMYHGLIAERSGLDTALEAIHRIRREIPNLQFEVYGDGDFVKPFLVKIEELNLQSIVHYYGYKSQEIIAQVIQTIDLGIISNKISPFTRLNLPTRIFEYLSVSKPVIAPRTKGILDYFGPDSLYFFEPGDPQSLADAFLQVYRNKFQRQEILHRGRKVFQTYRWELQRRYFIDVVKNLFKENHR